jgi:mono/diheme cytochrome c family protein
VRISKKFRIAQYRRPIVGPLPVDGDRMIRPLVIGAIVGLYGLTLAAQAPSRLAAAPARAARAQVAAADAATYRAMLDTYCVSCHNQRLKTGDLTLDSIDIADPGANADVWEKVVRKVRVGMMPPQGARPLEPDARASLLRWLTSSLDRASAARPNPGRPLVHRLNRTEYGNAVRDLLALEIDPGTLLPPDDSAYGFDNVADVLGISPVLLERYLSAAGKVSALAVGDPEGGLVSETFRVRQDGSQDSHIDGLPIGTVGGMLARTTVPLDGEYVIQPRLFRTNLGAMRGLEYEHQIEITVDGERVHVAAFGGDEDFKASLTNPTLAGDAVDTRGRVRLRLTAGPHAIGVAFVEKAAVQNSWRLQPFLRSSHDTFDPTGYPHLDSFSLTGPYNPTGPGDTPSRRRIFTCRPATAADEEPCARRIVTTLAHLAFRGEETDEDLTRLMSFYATGRRGGDFERGVQLALERMLASARFALRIEREPAGAAPGSVYRISDLELASRLSFFLWSSIPDAELIRAARDGRLHTPAVLHQQVRRMLADPKSASIVTNFAEQWLYLRNLKNMVPLSTTFVDFDDNLRQAFEREAQLFFESIVREDRSVVDLMTADYTFINERLAKHYGIPGIYGSRYRRVTLTDETRKGLLGKGAILMVTSHTDRTSPVVRGKWVLDNLLGTPPPPMPANVPPLDESGQDNGKVLTMRQRMEAHRRNPVCANCHRIMDPIGLSLENFDAVGAWRTREGGTRGTAIDASGVLLDGTAVDGVVSLRHALLRDPEIFVGTFVEKLMTFALGRGVASYDMPTVRAIVRESAGRGYRFTAIVDGIIGSPAFQMRRAAAAEEQ